MTLRRAPLLLALAAALLAVSGSVAGASAPTARLKVDRFDGKAAFALLKRQVAFGPRPAGSPPSRKLAVLLRARLPGGHFQPVGGGLRNVIGVVRGRRPRRVVVIGAHYDTVDLPGFVGANDGASGTAVVVQLARTVRPRSLRPTVVFALFDGEEAPPDTDFDLNGLRGSRVAANHYRSAEAMVLLDMVGDRDLEIFRERSSDARLWAKLRAGAQRVGAGPTFPARVGGQIIDDHSPFVDAGVPAIDVIDFEFPCWHEPCDNLTAVSARSLDAVGETVLQLLRSF